jgi:hypothetical protein
LVAANVLSPVAPERNHVQGVGAEHPRRTRRHYDGTAQHRKPLVRSGVQRRRIQACGAFGKGPNRFLSSARARARSSRTLQHSHLNPTKCAETPIKKLRVDLGSEDVCSGLRDKWADGRLFLKDLGTSDLDCTSSATKSRDETLLDTIVDNWNHLRHFREDADHMTPVEMRQWLQEWQASSEAGKVIDLNH